MKRFVFLLLFPVVIAYSSERFSVELLSQFYLDQKKEPLGLPGDIAIDENENIFVTDSLSYNIKIYSKDGKLTKVFGRKGAGPGEFLCPFRLDYDNGIICIQDIGHFKYIMFNKDFTEIGRFFFLIGGSDTFVLDRDRIITNGYFRDKRKGEFRGIIFDLSGKIIKTLIPLSYPRNDAWNRVTDSLAFLDVSKNGEIYLVKSRGVSFFKFNKEGKLLKNFGKNPSYFLPAKRTKDFDIMIEQGPTSKDREAGQRWRSSFSWVSGIFVLEDFVGIAIRNFNKKVNKWECFLQFYDLNGNLLEEGVKLKEVGTSSDAGFFMDSNHKDTIYILEIIEEEEPQYRFSKYKVIR